MLDLKLSKDTTTGARAESMADFTCSAMVEHISEIRVTEIFQIQRQLVPLTLCHGSGIFKFPFAFQKP